MILSPVMTSQCTCSLYRKRFKDVLWIFIYSCYKTYLGGYISNEQIRVCKTHFPLATFDFITNHWTAISTHMSMIAPWWILLVSSLIANVGWCWLPVFCSKLSFSSCAPKVFCRPKFAQRFSESKIQFKSISWRLLIFSYARVTF